MQFKKQLLVAAITTLVSSSVLATNGYAPHGVGQKSQGMGGVGVAYPQDSLAGGVNPAGMVHVGNRIDLGANLFSPQRESTFIPTGVTYDANDKDLFLIPEFGYNHMLNNNTSIGVSVFGTGGMNTDYNINPYGPFGMPAGTVGVNLMQLFIVPTLAYKINDNHSIGIGLNLAAQAFAAKGIAGFGGFGVGSSDPANVSDNGHDTSYGAGLRLGWQGKVSDRVTLGATYQTRTYMSELDDYAGLFAEQGDFDIPENFAIGIAVAATPKLNIAFDVMRINYSKVNAIGNPNNFFIGAAQLGADNGAGFGWEDQTVYKLGFDYAYSSDLTLRAGINHAKTPITASQTTFNVLAPGVVETHLTLGATWNMQNGNELTFSYMHAFENSVNGDGNAFNTGSYNLKMHQDAIGVAYSWKM